jgi:hypothetical protein
MTAVMAVVKLLMTEMMTVMMDAVLSSNDCSVMNSDDSRIVMTVFFYCNDN